MGCFSGSTASAIATTPPGTTNANPQMIAKVFLKARLSAIDVWRSFFA
jgi:hypothetical protein